MKPNLFIVGAPKCGTSAWAHYLGDHPDIYFSPVKEPHYFAFDLPGRRDVASMTDYEALFRQAGLETVIGEASVLYLFSEVAAKEIAAYNPDARVLIFVRPQEDMLPSLHHQFLYSFNESIADFATAWRLSGKRPPETVPDSCREPKLLDYAAIGRFDVQVERYLRHFPAEQVRVIHFDDWVGDPRATYSAVLDFLGVADDGRTDFPPVNEAKYHRIGALARFLGRPPAWLDRAAGAARRLLRTRSLGVGARLNRLNQARGYSTEVPPELRQEIRLYYEPHNRALAKRMGRPS